jgi:hypothetical protein
MALNGPGKCCLSGHEYPHRIGDAAQRPAVLNLAEAFWIFG